jgi:hypothetical protein
VSLLAPPPRSLDSNHKLHSATKRQILSASRRRRRRNFEKKMKKKKKCTQQQAKGEYLVVVMVVWCSACGPWILGHQSFSLSQPVQCGDGGGGDGGGSSGDTGSPRGREAWQRSFGPFVSGILLVLPLTQKKGIIEPASRLPSHTAMRSNHLVTAPPASLSALSSAVSAAADNSVRCVHVSCGHSRLAGHWITHC